MHLRQVELNCKCKLLICENVVKIKSPMTQKKYFFIIHDDCFAEQNRSVSYMLLFST